MNKLNTFLSFVLLSFCLLINVSYAKVFNNVTGTINSTEFNELVANSINPTELTERDSYIINSAIEYLTKNNLYDPTNYSYYFVRNTSNSLYKIYRHPISNGRNPTYVMGQPYNNNMRYNLSSDYAYVSSIVLDNSNNFSYCSDFTLNTNSYNLYLAYYDTTSTTLYTYDDITTAISSVDLALYTSNPDFGLVYYQQYTSYAKQNPSISVVNNYYMYGTAPDEPSPDEPIMPSNSEIASAVQLFYNSVYQLPNIAFDDFFVLYDTSTKNYLYIGHTRGNALGQVIVEPNGYYDGFKFDVQWWKFFLDEQEDAWNWQNISKYNNYFLYTSKGSADTLENAGQGKISELLSSGPWATSTTIIVYSTTDYPVKYVTFAEDSPDPNVQTGTIKGDQYTYDEDLDITDNQYNPLDSFVTIDYPSTLVSRADFEGFMSIFNDNSRFAILPSNANWIIIANNSLFEHFSSFIIMCTVFIILQRFMRG